MNTLICAAMAAAPLLSPAMAAQSKKVEVAAGDGAKLRRTYTSPSRPGPGMVQNRFVASRCTPVRQQPGTRIE